MSLVGHISPGVRTQPSNDGELGQVTDVTTGLETLSSAPTASTPR